MAVESKAPMKPIQAVLQWRQMSIKNNVRQLSNNELSFSIDVGFNQSLTLIN